MLLRILIVGISASKVYFLLFSTPKKSNFFKFFFWNQFVMFEALFSSETYGTSIFFNFRKFSQLFRLLLKIKLGWVNLSGFQNLSKNSMICCPKIPPPKFHCARISIGFWWEVKWLWSPLCFSTLVPLPSHYPSN